MNVYIAASAADISRAKYYHTRLEGLGVTVVSTWIQLVESTGCSNPREATNAQRLAWAHGDFIELDRASILWFLVPPLELPTRGAWCELAYAHARGIEIVCSGDTRQSIFCALGEEYDLDEMALDAVVKLATGVVR